MTTYRYALFRNTGLLDGRGVGVFVMLNPSTADAGPDGLNDPTIRRCLSFAEREGWARMMVVNLFGARSTDPAALREMADPVGPENDAAIGEALDIAGRHARPVVAAWGAHPFAADRVRQVVARWPEEEWWCLGRTADGSPRHPLYVRSAAPLVAWKPPA